VIALDAARRPQLPAAYYTALFDRTPMAVGAARRMACQALSTWGLEHLLDDAILVLSELVTNAIQHTSIHALHVTVARVGAERIRIAVDDDSDDYPCTRPGVKGQESGWGWSIVGQLAARVGVDETPEGKTVWAEIA
jgi:serine/threonine-protein kinase RsbW